MEPYSVLMAVYRGEKAAYLRSALESVLHQTVPPEEILLVCDGPLTETLEQLIGEFSQLEPERFRVLRLEQNRGLGAALNAGLGQCRNELVARMDSDDLSLPDRMELQLAELARCPQVSVLGGQIVEFQDEEQGPLAYRTVPEAEREIREFIRRRNPMNHVSVVFRKEHILQAGGYPEFSGPGFEDYYLWATLLAQGRKLKNIPAVCCRVRVNPGQYSRRGGLGYFRNAERVQQLLLETGLIGPWEYWRNLAVWFGSAVLLTARVRRLLCLIFLRRSDFREGSRRNRMRREDRYHEASGYQS